MEGFPLSQLHHECIPKSNFSNLRRGQFQNCDSPTSCTYNECNELCNEYRSTDADDETINNDKDDEDMDPSWKLSDAEQFISDDDMEVELSEDEFQESHPGREKQIMVFGSCLNELHVLKECLDKTTLIILDNTVCNLQLNRIKIFSTSSQGPTRLCLRTNSLLRTL